MPSRIIPPTGAVKGPVCSRAAAYSKQAASLDASELKGNLAILTKREAVSPLKFNTASDREDAILRRNWR